MKGRIMSAGWENFTGPFGMGVMFEDGVSTTDLSLRAILRIGSIVILVDAEDPERQLGQSSAMVELTSDDMPVAPVHETGTESEARLAGETAAKEAEAAADKEAADKRKADEAAALEAARAKAEAETPVVYSRQELEAIGHNDGIKGLRAIGDKLNVKGRSVTEMVKEILDAQTKALTK